MRLVWQKIQNQRREEGSGSGGENQEDTCPTFQPSSGGGEGESRTPLRGCRRSSVPRFPFEREGERMFIEEFEDIGHFAHG